MCTFTIAFYTPTDDIYVTDSHTLKGMRSSDLENESSPIIIGAAAEAEMKVLA